MAYRQNPGQLPDEAIVLDEGGHAVGYRNVHVRLFGGFDSRKAGHAPWPAGGGRPPTCWAISRDEHPFEIESYEVA